MDSGLDVKGIGVPGVPYEALELLLDGGCGGMELVGELAWLGREPARVVLIVGPYALDPSATDNRPLWPTTRVVGISGERGTIPKASMSTQPLLVVLVFRVRAEEHHAPAF